MIDHFRMFADYNRWANDRLYTAAATLSEAELNESRGAFFGSLMATLNHLVVADGIWMKRFTGQGETANQLAAILHPDLASLTAARKAIDARIIQWLEGLEPAALDQPVTYSAITNPTPITHALAPGLSHMFNHQTHHRGQCHMTLTALGKESLVLDLIYFLRSEGKEWLAPGI
ncbi:Uncharacterized damage-inducible protein DinB (forms a four-helix bundle) [Rhizobium sp. RU20A]|uniref:DinB family protein n=1 Tax=Rhizobium sp. RU20A TaxID=1907412 RepID=UPI0009539DE0|nr:DinB family protein [Rhizobium sp. RU20A]SIP94063.1 Uncharacterized damage-inducible protein DinB (forms a four-helix bundle) [Rhizobium sp. RU20A]